ncbi:porin [Polynucleobacter sphagniphilus]|uniref:porin n=1 Tax=Polynucleobacter sphagniphilus TaxID=1743169 RepID=UPI002405CEED|nr:porin [Polynucleobacter sphagniphilus]MDF9789019.1 GBP family porin [Polynucleobacter sphagniphilus]
MKKSLLAIAAMTAFAGAAQAQSSVTVYGLLDVAVIGQTNTGNLNSTASTVPAALAGNNAGGGSAIKPGTAFGVTSNGESMSRLGFKGSEDLGGGTKAIFTLEQGFSPSTGELGNTGMLNQGTHSSSISGDTSIQGQLFNRGAFVGLSDDKFGTLTAGRQQNLMLDNIGNYDPVAAFAVSPLQYSGSYGGAGRTDEARVDGALKYVWKSNGFNANLLYAPGGFASQTTMGTTSGAQVGYEAGKFGVQAIASHTTDAMNLTAGQNTATTLGSINTNTQSINVNFYNNTVVNTTAYMLTAKYQATDSLVFKGGYEREQIGTPSNFQNYNLATTTGGVALANVAGQANYFVNVAWIGAQYQLTPTIKVSGAYYYAGTPAAGPAATTACTAVFSSGSGGCTGTAQYEALTVDYSLSKRTNLYALLGNTTLTGAQKYSYATTTTGAATATMSGQQTYGLGIRHTF